MNDQAHRLQAMASSIYAQKETMSPAELMALLKSFPTKDAPGKVREAYSQVVAMVDKAIVEATEEKPIPSIERTPRASSMCR
jgi:hypothetical protein